MNIHSSRSHAIFTVAVECSEKGIDGNSTLHVGRLNLVCYAFLFIDLDSNLRLFCLERWTWLEVNDRPKVELQVFDCEKHPKSIGHYLHWEM